MYNLIMPVAGKSSRFAGTRPKWLLTHPNGDFMFYEALRGLPLDRFSRIFITCLQEHDRDYHCIQAIRNQAAKRGLGEKLKIVVLPEPTRHQPETVAETIRREQISGPVVVKDSDNYFELLPEPANFVSVLDVSTLPSDSNVKVFNKSFVTQNENGMIVNIAEKQVVGNLMVTGAYGFESATTFIRYYESLAAERNLYLSHVIYSMILDNHSFQARECKNYLDWGTLEDWLGYCARFATLFVDLDGTLVENSAEMFDPVWGTTRGIPENIACLNSLYDSGKVRVIITTSRAASFREATLAQLTREGIKYHDILFGLNHGKRIIINDYSTTNPYRSCDAINILRNSTQLRALVKGTLPG